MSSNYTYTYAFTPSPTYTDTYSAYDKSDQCYEKHKVALILMSLLFSFPNVVMAAYKVFTCSRCSSLCSFLHCLSVNLLYAFLICDFILCGDMFMGSIITLCTVSSHILLSCLFLLDHNCQTCPCCSICPDCCEIMCNENLQVSHLEDAVDVNRSLPLSITINGCAQHEESREVWEEYELVKKKTWDEDGYGNKSNYRTYTVENHIATHYSPWGRVDRGGGHFRSTPGYSSSHYRKLEAEKRTVTLWEQSYDFCFNTWEDQTEPFNVPYNALIRVHFTPKYIVPDREKGLLQVKEDEVRREALRHDTDVYVNTVYKVRGFHESGYIGENIVKLEEMKEFAKTCCAKFLGVFLFFAGYNFVYECIYRVNYDEISVAIIKCVSADNNLRAGWRKRDMNYIAFDYKRNYNKAEEREEDNDQKEDNNDQLEDNNDQKEEDNDQEEV